MTYSCSYCGRPHLTESSAFKCCRRETCRACAGTGKKESMIGPAIKCPYCQGTGIA